MIKKSLFLLPLIFSIMLSSPLLSKSAFQFNEEGWKAYNQHEYSQAITLFRQALRLNGRYADAMVGLGYCYLEKKAWHQALELFEKTLVITPDLDTALNGRAEALLGLGEYKSALKAYSDAVDISEENLDAHFGIAKVYYGMGKKLWAHRRLDHVFRINPFHYDSLLLKGKLKAEEGRYDDAKAVIEKGIGSREGDPAGYVALAEILLMEASRENDADSLEEAYVALDNALAIQPGYADANRLLGLLYHNAGDYDNAIGRFRVLTENGTDPSTMHILARSLERAGRNDDALRYYLKTYDLYPSDDVLRNQMESFLVLNEYPVGHPARIMLYREAAKRAASYRRKNLPDSTIYALRRAVLLNPMDNSIREDLIEYYRVLDYNRFYIDELKELQRIDDSGRYRQRLTVAIHKRRDRMYHIEGLSEEMPPRDVPVVTVLNLQPRSILQNHPDAGEALADSLSYGLMQMGRMRPLGIRQRRDLVSPLGGDITEAMKTLPEKAEYLLYGTYHTVGPELALSLRMLDLKRGFVIKNFSASSNDLYSVDSVVLSIVKDVYDSIPYSGRILKTDEEKAVINLGSFDGLKKDDRLLVNKERGGKNYRIILTVTEVDTVVSAARPERQDRLEILDSRDTVMPLKNRRARMIR